MNLTSNRNMSHSLETNVILIWQLVFFFS
jgi:hypothetical protein